jgi:predicted enzyme related to lactoylglutathione lyase
MCGFESMITFFPVRDLEETHRFYSGVMGLAMVLDQGSCRIYRVAEGAFIGFCTSMEATGSPGVTITLVTGQVDLWFEKAREAGCRVIKKPAKNPEFNIYNCFLEDPSGHTLEIQRFEDPRWTFTE